MSGFDVVRLLGMSGWTVQELGRRLQIDWRIIRRWTQGTLAIVPPYDLAIEALLRREQDRLAKTLVRRFTTTTPTVN